MPDPLTYATEQMAPSQATTSFFDPTQGEDVISRYANARRGLETSALVSDATSRLLKDRTDRAEARREAMRFDRDEQDYQDQQEFKAQRGQFLETLGAIDSTADDYDTQISDVIKNLPPAALEDDAVKALLTHKNRIADSVRTEKEMQLRREETFKDRKELQKMRYDNDPRLAVLSQEERQKHIDPVTGEFDSVGASIEAYQKSRGDKMGDSKELIAERARVAAEQKDTASAQVKRSIVGDTTAFPSQVSSFMAAHPEFDPKDTTPEILAQYEAAKEYDKVKPDAEMESARNYSREEYIAKGGKLSPAQAKKRAEVWDYANGDAKAPAAAKPLTADLAKEFLSKSGGDKAKAREMAKAQGYTF